MAKYCVTCGKTLPDGVEVCPDCSTAPQESEAALFTTMTAETEVWKSAEPVKERKPLFTEKRGRIIGLCAGAVALVCVALVLVLLFRPAARVARLIRAGELTEAYELYWTSNGLPEKARVDVIDKAILEAADRICRQYADNEINAKMAAEELSLLGGFGEGAADMLEEVYARFRSFNLSHEHWNTAKQLLDDGAFLEAREEFLLVEEQDANYAAAQEKAEECLVSYGEKVSAEAEKRMQNNAYTEAIALLQAGDDLLFSKNTFSAAIDAKLLECYDRYEQYLLDEARALEELEDYDAALKLLQEHQSEFPTQRSRMEEALDAYALLARDKHVADAGVRADAYYEDGDYAAAFAELETMRVQAKENEEGADALIEAMERRFEADMLAQAEETFGGERDRIPDTIDVLDTAIEIRPLETLREVRENLSRYLPLYLAQTEYASKDGTVFRSDTAFESLEGTTFRKGWLWGENGAEMTFALNGDYDVLECSFANRRDDDANANGHFEVWCDGEQVLKTETLYHFQKEVRTITLDVSGCQELKLVFVCDYEVKTADNGYCYHGICDPVATKNMDGVWRG